MIDIETSGIADFDRMIRRLGDDATLAARLAVNDGAEFARRLGAGEIRKQVNLPARYVTGGNAAARLAVRKKAHNEDLEAIVTGRDRATSLARFASGSKAPGRRRTPVKVRVKAQGAAKAIPGAFFVRLRRGSQDVGPDAFNVGLAIRLKPGQRLTGARQAVPFANGLYLLYGPSVGQVYRDVAEDSAGPVSDYVADRFAHHIERFMRG